MAVDFTLLFDIAEKVLLIAVGAAAAWFLERRPRLIVYYGHVGDFAAQDPEPRRVRTHSVVIRNIGRLAATNVRVPHHGNLATNQISLSVFPSTAYTVQTLPGGEDELLFSRFAPGQEITISYLYYLPIFFNQINARIYSDEGMAREITVLPRPQPQGWQLVILWGLAVTGAIAILYVAFEMSRWVLATAGQ
jgi:hypothetical protein